MRYRLRVTTRTTTAILVAACLLLCVSSTTAAPSTPTAVPDAALIKLDAACAATASASYVAAGWYRVDVAPSKALAAIPCAVAVAPDLVATIADGGATAPSTPAWNATADPLLGQQWHVAQVQAPSVWPVTRGEGAAVAVLDTGVDFTHPDLAGVFTSRGRDFITGHADASDDHGHGTHVAGILAAVADNGIGGAGVAPGARILPVKVLDASGSGSFSGILAGMDWASQQGVVALSLSLGAVTDESYPPMADTVALVRSRGVAVIAAAGNNSTPRFFSPAAEAGVIGVGATDSLDHRADFSNYGANARLAAPGVSILSTTRGGGYAAWNGTSMATPVASAVYALISAARPSLSLDAREARLLDGDTLPTDQPLGKRVNAAKSLGNTIPAPTATTVPVVVPTSTARPAFDAALVEGINAARGARGIPPIAVTDPRLTAISRGHNDAMNRCASGLGWQATCFSHQVPGEPDFAARLASAGYGTGGETIGQGYTSVAAMVAGWLASPGHAAILLDATYNRIGCAADDYAQGYPAGLLYTCVLAYDPRATPAPSPSPLPTATPRPTLTPTATPNPRGPLPSGRLMRIWLPDLGNTDTDCRTYGTGCFRVLQVDYDVLNRAPVDPWAVTDYLFYKYCGLPGVMCEWPPKGTR